MADHPAPKLPPLDGSLTVIPGFVDFHATHNPQHPWVLFPSFEDPTQPITFTFSELAKATHRVAHRVRPGRKGEDGEVVALLIHTDAILYSALIQGLIRAGIVPLPLSPRNSVQAITNLLEKTGAHRLILSPSLAAVATAAQSELASTGFKLEVEDLLSIHDVFPTIRSGAESTLEEGPYPERTTKHSPDETILILHSSGSTGLPKPIYETQKIMVQWASNGFTVESRKRPIRGASGALPSFHTMGISLQMLDPLATGQWVGLFTPQDPLPPPIPTPEKVLDLARVTKCNSITSVPTFIEIWAQSEEALKFLANLKVLGFSGGPLSPSTGDKLVKAGVFIQSIYGSTEGGIGASGAFDFEQWGKTPDEWIWITFNPKMSKARFVPEGDSTFELQFLTCDAHQPAIENLPDTKGYATSDLFEPHPTKKGLWKIVGRKDDVIVLGTGEKIVPIPQEGHLVSNSIVAGAVMFGREKMQPGVLVEPHPAHVVDPLDEAAVVNFRNKIWPIVQEANTDAPSFARIYKEMILISDPARPLPRAAKGTIIRKQALALYDKEIEDLLSATFLRNRIISALKTSPEPALQKAALHVSQNFVFDNPSVQRLSAAILRLRSGGGEENIRAQQIVEFLDKYTAGLPSPNATEPVGPAPTSRVVLLTGSTGNIGSHVLASLLSHKDVLKVYTLDRPSNKATPEERLLSGFTQRSLPAELLKGGRVTALTGDFNDERFGLDPATYDEIKGSLTNVLVNGWKVDFNQSLDSFENQIAGTRKLLDFCASLPQSVAVFFTSSISVAGKWDVSKGPVPEKTIDDPEVADASGYSASKYVTEQMLAKAYTKGLHTTSLRVGQVSGSAASGSWNVTDWVPILVKSSVALNMLPATPGIVSWIPIDAVADIVRDLVLAKEPVTPLVNVVHPRCISWEEVFKLLNDALDKPLPMVPFAQWIEKLEILNQNPTPQVLEDVPAVKLLQFFRGLKNVEGDDAAVEAGGLPRFETSQLQSQSETARTLAPIGSEHAHAWVRYWREQGLFKYSG
ncbi:acetyl-CoA synthetase-like protein [Trametopsis cervina]|nr:acetyl-CoA synthetase-like protein [Trametopsis cervina]